jgi:hypothetical protein
VVTVVALLASGPVEHFVAALHRRAIGVTIRRHRAHGARVAGFGYGIDMPIATDGRRTVGVTIRDVDCDPVRVDVSRVADFSSARVDLAVTARAHRAVDVAVRALAAVVARFGHSIDVPIATDDRCTVGVTIRDVDCNPVRVDVSRVADFSSARVDLAVTARAYRAVDVAAHALASVVARLGHGIDVPIATDDRRTVGVTIRDVDCGPVRVDDSRVADLSSASIDLAVTARAYRAVDVAARALAAVVAELISSRVGVLIPAASHRAIDVADRGIPRSPRVVAIVTLLANFEDPIAAAGHRLAVCAAVVAVHVVAVVAHLAHEVVQHAVATGLVGTTVRGAAILAIGIAVVTHLASCNV